MTILLAQDQEQTLKSLSEEVVTVGPFERWFIPYGYKYLGDGLYERVSIQNIPETVKEQLTVANEAL